MKTVLLFTDKHNSAVYLLVLDRYANIWNYRCQISNKWHSR